MIENKYDALAQHIEDLLRNNEMEANVIVGSTDLVDWNTQVNDSDVIYGVLQLVGGRTETVSDATYQEENFSIAFALPNNERTDFANALGVLDSTFSALNDTDVTLYGDACKIFNGGRNNANYLTIRGGKQIGVVVCNITLLTITELLATSDATITIQTDSMSEAETLKGLINYNFSKVVTFDGVVNQSTTTQLNFKKSVSKTISISFRKFKSDTLHNALVDADTLTISILDGSTDDEDSAITIYSGTMNVQSYSQNAVAGSFVVASLNLIDGVVS